MISCCSRHCSVGKCNYLGAESSCTETSHNTTTDSNIIVVHSLRPTRLTQLQMPYGVFWMCKWIYMHEMSTYEISGFNEQKSWLDLLNAHTGKKLTCPWVRLYPFAGLSTSCKKTEKINSDSMSESGKTKSSSKFSGFKYKQSMNKIHSTPLHGVGLRPAVVELGSV
jgi:hypothetical protein